MEETENEETETEPRYKLSDFTPQPCPWPLTTLYYNDSNIIMKGKCNAI